MGNNKTREFKRQHRDLALKSIKNTFAAWPVIQLMNTNYQGRSIAAHLVFNLFLSILSNFLYLGALFDNS